MKLPIPILAALALPALVVAADVTPDWKPAPVALVTRWAKDVSPTNALKEYPRPQMTRENWSNLNGLWEYAITPRGATQPAAFAGRILVPYPLESALSGVQKRLRPDQNLWYRRSIEFKAGTPGKTLLHFGAVDNEATVFVNGKEIGKHAGGYTEFSFDITAALQDGKNELVVKVFDPTEYGVYPHGKQVSNPANIYYTPSSGIWQTVWLEQVPADYIEKLTFTPDVDQSLLSIAVKAPAGCAVEITALDGATKAGTITGQAGETLKLPVKNPKLWSPDNPFLYNLTVKLVRDGKAVDEVKSYFGMRKISVGKDAQGHERILLNNKYVFHLGTLDQGFWPDGLMTAPTDEALKFDLEAIKAMGFNTIRKHIKIEPARWYYHADKLGMIVWQDFVNPPQGLPDGAKTAFEKQGKEMLAQLHNYPSIALWVLFNEKWGAYDQQRLTEWVKATDPSRLVNGHSGELLWVDEQLRSPSPNAWVSSDIADVHSYPDPRNAPAAEGRVRILGEFGGIGVFIPDHQWLANKSWGYVQVTPSQLLGKYTILNQNLQILEKEGLAGSIYTQPFDVEGEENGLMTYDREVVKIPFAALRKIHAPLNPAIGTLPNVSAQDADLTDPGVRYSRMLQQYIDGKRDTQFLKTLAMMAAVVGDKSGGARAANNLIAGLKQPLSDDDVRLVVQFTQSTQDAGIKLMTDNPEQFSRVMGAAEYRAATMNMIFRGEMEPLIANNPKPDWATMAQKVKPYGALGEEIFLRAKAIHLLNTQNWADYGPVATEYLQKYGGNIAENERNALQGYLDQHKN